MKNKKLSSDEKSNSQVLHHVLKNGSSRDICALLLCKVNLKCTYNNGDTVYHAVLKNQKLIEQDIVDICKIFHDRKVNLDTENNNGVTPLHLAIKRRMIVLSDFFVRCLQSGTSKPINYDVMLFFVKDEIFKLWQQVNQNCDDNQLWNSEKIENESAKFAEWLISKLDCNENKLQDLVNLVVYRNLHHLTHIFLGQATNRYGLAHCLLEQFLFRNGYARNVNSHKLSIKLWYSSYSLRYSPKIVKILIDKGALNNCWLENVRLAINQGEDITVIKMLIDYAPKNCIKSGSVSSLLNELMKCKDLAVSNIETYLQILHLLLAKGADLNVENKSGMVPIQEAIKVQNTHALGWLEEVGADFSVLTKDDQSLLHLLVSEIRNKGEQQFSLLDWLVSKGCNINGQDASGLTPVHLAVRSNNVALIRKLMEHGADINCTDQNRQTPLHHAVMYSGTTDVVEFLLENGANVHARDSTDMETLWVASPRSFRGQGGNMAKLLLQYGAQVNSIHSISDKTILKRVAGSMRKDTVEELLKCGLDVNGSCFCRYLYSHSRDTQELLDMHCVKLRAANLHWSEDYRSDDEKVVSFIAFEKLYEEHSKKCWKEVKTLQTTYINNRISLYDFLRMNLDYKCRYINNENLMKLIDSPKLKAELPQYSVLIVAGYRSALARKCLMESAKQAWLKLTEIHLPEICIEGILSFLDGGELVGMIGAD